MRRCEICGKRFRLLAKNRYEIVKRPVGINCLVQAAVYFNAFDCPHCGCQNIVGVVEKDVVESKSVSGADKEGNDADSN